MKLLDTLTKENNPILHFVFTFLSLCLIYRLWMLEGAAYVPGVPMDSAVIFLSNGVITDIVMAILFGGILFLLRNIFCYFFAKNKSVMKIAKPLGILSIYIILLLIALDFATQREIFHQLNIGLTYGLLKEASQGLTVQQYISDIQWQDYLFLSSPLIIFSLFYFGNCKKIWKFNLYFLAPLCMLLFLGGKTLFWLSPPANTLEYPEFYFNPIAYTLDDIFWTTENKYTKLHQKPSQAQLHRVALTDPEFILPGKAESHSLPPSASKPWNVVLIIMESTGNRYIFNTKRGNATPMPFLQSLTKDGLYFENNYTGGNASTLGGFTILGSLNPSPSFSRFEMQPNIHVPSIYTLLGKQYRSIFVTASSEKYYLPINYMLNSGLENAWGKEQIHVKNPQPGPPDFASEPDATTFFIEKMNALKPPFIATYWSGAPHWPYYDYGSQTHILPGKTKVQKYYNNLRVLDDQIHRIYDDVKANGLLDSTIFVFVGDHGEAFDQHDGEWGHGTSVYREETQVPVIFYQPKLFKPAVVTRPTSSLDILPTLLDAMHLKYNPEQFQGSSYFKPALNRHYIFVYGVEGTLAAIDVSTYIKMQISFAKGQCWAFDLKTDPGETKKLECDNYPKQFDAMIRYKNYQPDMLEWYNNKVIEQKKQTKN